MPDGFAFDVEGNLITTKALPQGGIWKRSLAVVARIGVAALLVPVPGALLHLGSDASTQSGCVDPTPDKYLPTQTLISAPVNQQAATELAGLKATQEQNNSALPADLQQAAAMSSGQVVTEKMNTIAALRHDIVPPNMPISACGAIVQRGSLARKLRMTLDAYAADGYTSGTDNGKSFARLNYMNQQPQQCRYLQRQWSKT